jgi:hypothetical protein
MKAADLQRRLRAFADAYATRREAPDVPLLVAAGLVINRRLGVPRPWGASPSAPAEQFEEDLTAARAMTDFPPRRFLVRENGAWRACEAENDVLTEWQAALAAADRAAPPSPIPAAASLQLP